MSALAEPVPQTAPKLIEVEDLHVRFTTKRGLLHAVNGVSLEGA